MKTMLPFLLLLITINVLSQDQQLIIKGDVKDATSGKPLAYATIGVTGHIEQTVSDASGNFELNLSSSPKNDTLIVTYIGYSRFTKSAARLSSFEHILLTENAIVLDEVTILRLQLDLRDVDRYARIIRDNIYAMDNEVTNLEYNTFLSWMEDPESKKKYGFKLDQYPKSVQEFYEKYHQPGTTKKSHSRNSTESFNRYPAVNITHESAIEYCKWLTDRYNENTKKKKFKKVMFRLPTFNEWQIAALGYSKFQSWNFRDNSVEIIMAKDTTNFFKGEKKMMKIDDTILYPWFKVYHMRSRVYNQFGCYLGNFKITTDRNCMSRALAYDGFTMQAFTRAYFPNDIGLYDVVGNVAEMIDENGKACGGSWNDVPENSTIQSVKSYNGSDETVGFRVFMEVIEK